MKDSNWLPYVKLRPENEPTQQKKWTILRQKKNIDPLLKMQSHFLHVSDSEVIIVIMMIDMISYYIVVA